MVDKNEVFEYLDELRDSGVTNMFGAAPYICLAFAVTTAEGRALLLEWMNTFEERHKTA